MVDLRFCDCFKIILLTLQKQKNHTGCLLTRSRYKYNKMLHFSTADIEQEILLENLNLFFLTVAQST